MNDTEFAAIDFSQKQTEEVLTAVVEYLLPLPHEQFLAQWGVLAQSEQYNLIWVHRFLKDKILDSIFACGRAEAGT